MKFSKCQIKLIIIFFYLANALSLVQSYLLAESQNAEKYISKNTQRLDQNFKVHNDKNERFQALPVFSFVIYRKLKTQNVSVYFNFW